MTHKTDLFNLILVLSCLVYSCSADRNDASNEIQIESSSTFIGENETTFENADFDSQRKVIDNKYDSLILTADSCFQERNFVDSKDYYQRALLLKPYEKYPKDMIAHSDSLNKIE